MQELTNISDDVLLRRIVAGEAEALSVLYDRYERGVFSLLQGMLRNTDDAEDIMQEVFTQVWRKADTYSPVFGGAKNWLLRIAHNLAINYLRSRNARQNQLRVPLESVESMPSGSDLSTVNAILEQDEVRHLNSAIEKLPPDQKSLIALAFLQGLSHSEIAAQTSLPIGTVKTRIRSGLSNLRKELDHLSPEYPASVSVFRSSQSTSA